jgi:hypothetical protein
MKSTSKTAKLPAGYTKITYRKINRTADEAGLGMFRGALVTRAGAAGMDEFIKRMNSKRI